MKRLFFFIAAIIFSLNAATLLATHKQIKIEVWSTSDYDDYCDYEDIDYFLRPERNCYVAIMMVDPDGYANIIYPQEYSRQFKLRRGRVYRLSDLLDGDPIYFAGVDGEAFISVITSRHPIHADRWLLDEFTAYVNYEYSPSFSFEIGFGNGFRIGWRKHLRYRGFGVCSVPFVVHNYYHPRRSVYYTTNYRHKRWDRRWQHRTRKPVVRRKKSIWDRDHYFVREQVRQRENFARRKNQNKVQSRQVKKYNKSRRRKNMEPERRFEREKSEEKFVYHKEKMFSKSRKKSNDKRSKNKISHKKSDRLKEKRRSTKRKV